MTGSWIALGVVGALCWLAAYLGMSAAGRASGAARTAVRSELAARSASAEALDAALVARVTVGVHDVGEHARYRDAEVSERIRRDLIAAGVTARRINDRASAAALHRRPRPGLAPDAAALDPAAAPAVGPAHPST